MKHKGTKRLTTERLILRRFEISDAEAMFQNWANDDEVTRYLTWPSHGDVSVTEAVLQDWIGNYSNPDYYQWVIALKDAEHEPVGNIGVVSQNEKTELAHIGYCLSRQLWHKGIVSEALQAVIRYLFDEVEYGCIQSMHDPRNPNSGKVMEKCGMQYEGTLRHAAWNNQGICDASYYSILRREYQASKIKLQVIREQTNRALWEVGNVIDCIPDALWDKEYCGMPMWKHVYHMLHSLDLWYINPRDRHYAEPSIHEPNLNNLDVSSEKRLTRGEIDCYWKLVNHKIRSYLLELTDDQLDECPPDCEYSRFTLILAQFRHLHSHMGMIMGFIIDDTGLWPRVLGLETPVPEGDYHKFF